MATESAVNVPSLPSPSCASHFITQMAWVFMPDVRLDNYSSKSCMSTLFGDKKFIPNAPFIISWLAE